MPVIANTGAMLLIGQERSKLNAALAAESRCEAIVPVRPRLTLVEFQALTTAARGRHVLLTIPPNTISPCFGVG